MRGISISAGYLSNLLIKNHFLFETEKQEVYDSGLASSPWQHFDQRSARVGGVNYTTNIICNPLYKALQEVKPGIRLPYCIENDRWLAGLAKSL